MLSDEELLSRLRDLEADHVERTRAAQDRTKIGEAICAFANDLPRRRQPGTLFLGVDAQGGCARLEITDALLLALEDYARNGVIVPLPVMHVRKATIDGCPLVVVEVEPSDNPPVKFDGRVHVRRGPKRGVATPEEEKRLTERRIWGNLPVDQQPVPGTSINDLDLLRFQQEYLPAEVAPDVLAENGRALPDQLRALRLLAPDGRATVAGLLIVGKDPLAWLPGAYVQFVRYPGVEIGEIIRDEKEVSGPLPHVFRALDEILTAHIEVRGSFQASGRLAAPPIRSSLFKNSSAMRSFIATTGQATAPSD